MGQRQYQITHEAPQWLLNIPFRIRKRMGVARMGAARNAATYLGRPQSRNPHEHRTIRRRKIDDFVRFYLETRC